MAAPPRTANTGTFFLTAITYNRRRLFQVEANAKLFIETLQHYRAEGFYKLHAFVVMPDHVHLLLTTDDLAKAMQRVKGGFSHRIGSNFPVWQRGFTDHLVPNRDHFESRREYIHQNPVNERLAERREDYPYSSAYRLARREPHPAPPAEPSCPATAHATDATNAEAPQAGTRR